MSYSDFFEMGGFFIVLLGTILAGRKWTDTKVESAKKETTIRADAARALAEQARAELADHRLHVAETYVSKQGLREVKDEIMIAVREVKGGVDGMNQRMDRIVERQIDSKA